MWLVTVPAEQLLSSLTTAADVLLAGGWLVCRSQHVLLLLSVRPLLQLQSCQLHCHLPLCSAATHRTDVRHLLGAHIVSVYNERLVKGVQVVAQAVVVLHTVKTYHPGQQQLP